ncbi:hypothetical protein KAU39_00670, partial [bacterium]|nr:hypothetical protein [bacterium]
MDIKLLKSIGITVIILTLLFSLGDAATWTIGSDGNSWESSVTYDNTNAIRSTGYVELQKPVYDYLAHWRFDEGSG